MKKQHIIRSILAAELVLLVPLVSMLFTDEVDWKIPDYIIVGILLAGVGFAYHLITTGVRSNSRLVVVGIVLAALMILTWIELAVGLFGSPFAGS